MHPSTFDIQGHRGARGLHPENTIPGFMAALELGVTTLEMDAVISRDRRVVISHEPWFSRAICRQPDGRRIPILRQRRFRLFEMSYAEISRFDCGSLRHPHFPQQQPRPAPKPLLADVFARSEARAAELGRAPVFYSIETKAKPEWDGIYHPDPETFARLLLEEIEAAGVGERTIVQSFDVRTLRSMKRLAPSLRLSLLAERKQVRDIDGNVTLLGFEPDIYSPHHAPVDAVLVERAHEKGMDVIPWTVNDALRMKELVEMGADGVITDYPDVALRALGR